MEGDPRQGLYVRAIDLGAELQPVTAAMTTYVIAAIAVLVAIGIVGWFVTGRLLSPIRHLRETADAITISDLSRRLEPHGNDDISDLSRTVNSMLDRLEDSVDVQRQLLDDVRHELKTPITIVRGHLELMDPQDAADVAAAREIGIAELDRLTRLVEDIDLLATAEADSYTDGGRRPRVAHVARRRARRRDPRPHLDRRGDRRRRRRSATRTACCRPGSSSPTTPPSTRPPAVRSRSAARATPRARACGCATTARASRRPRAPASSAASTAPTASASVGGSGLGLAIVDAITKGHGGHCTVTDTPGGGATFTIHLPPTAAELPAPVRAGDVVLQREAAG